MSRTEVARRLASLYELRSLRYYVRWKVAADPAYEAVLARVRDSSLPLLDFGCGVGLLPFFLREHGVTVPIVGVDFDERKIAVARIAARRYRGIDFLTSSSNDALPDGHNIVVLDVLHYLPLEERQSFLMRIAKAIPPEGMVVIREGIRDGSWRYRLTRAVDRFGRAIRWMRAARVEFMTREEILAPFAGFDVEVTPLWGRMPYNNYLFVMRRHAAA